MSESAGVTPGPNLAWATDAEKHKLRINWNWLILVKIIVTTVLDNLGSERSKVTYSVTGSV